jgi:hypothetical protein
MINQMLEAMAKLTRATLLKILIQIHVWPNSSGTKAVCGSPMLVTKDVPVHIVGLAAANGSRRSIG